jgi:3-oxoacyl-[acyl-carrier protein] reductase
MQKEFTPFKVDNQILVTGGSKGLGLKVVLELNRKGIPCVIFSRNPISDANQNLILKNSSCKNTVILGDVGNEKDVKELFVEMAKKSIQLSGAVHCAAILGELGSIENLSIKKWHETVRTNLHGTFHVLQECVRTFKLNGSGNFVALSGGGATDPRPKILPYAATKTAIVRLIESVAADNRNSGLTFNCVAPGILPTEMNMEAINLGKGILEDDYLAKISKAFVDNPEDSFLKPIKLICDLVLGKMPHLNGKIISAQWDSLDFENFLELEESMYTLRRVTPQTNDALNMK